MDGVTENYQHDPPGLELVLPEVILQGLRSAEEHPLAAIPQLSLSYGYGASQGHDQTGRHVLTEISQRHRLLEHQWLSGRQEEYQPLGEPSMEVQDQHRGHMGLAQARRQAHHRVLRDTSQGDLVLVVPELWVVGVEEGQVQGF